MSSAVAEPITEAGQSPLCLGDHVAVIIQNQ